MKNHLLAFMMVKHGRIVARALSFMEIMFTLTVFCAMLGPLLLLQSSNLRMVSRSQADAKAALLMKSETDALLFENYDNLKSYSKSFDDEGNQTDGSWSSSDENSLVASDRHFAKGKWGKSRYVLTVNVEEDASRVKSIKKISITCFVRSNLLGYVRYRGYVEKTKPEDIPGSTN